MAVRALAAAILLTVAVCVTASDDPTVSLDGVIDLKPDNFKTHVNGAKAALIEFYAPWCGHCKRMVPELKKLGELIQSNPKLKTRVVIAKVDADAHSSLGSEYGVQGFPTIKWFPRGKVPSKDAAEDYTSARSADKFLEFIEEKLAADKGFARVEELDAIASKFGAAPKAEAEKLLAEAKTKLEALKDDAKKNGELYIKVMQKAIEKGADYFSKEAARLERVIASGSVNTAKLDEMSRKSSVLSAFVSDDVAETK